jgi:hypothetical protein
MITRRTARRPINGSLRPRRAAALDAYQQCVPQLYADHPGFDVSCAYRQLFPKQPDFQQGRWMRLSWRHVYGCGVLTQINLAFDDGRTINFDCSNTGACNDG